MLYFDIVDIIALTWAGHFSGKAEKYSREISIIEEGPDTLARFLLTWNTD